VSSTSNNITWLVWHMARVGDGWGWGTEQVAEMVEISKDNLIGYYADVRAVTLTELDKMTDADMSVPWSHLKSSLTSTGAIFGHIIVEESQHLGQIAFIRGMLRVMNN